MVSLLVSAIAGIFVVIEIFSLMPSIWNANVFPDPSQVFLQVAQNKPSIIVVWTTALVLAWVGYVGVRSRPWWAAPIVALVIIWTHELTGRFPGGHPAVVGTATQPSYELQVWLAFAIALVATGQGLRLWAMQTSKRTQEALPAFEPPLS